MKRLALLLGLGLFANACGIELNEDECVTDSDCDRIAPGTVCSPESWCVRPSAPIIEEDANRPQPDASGAGGAGGAPIVDAGAGGAGGEPGDAAAGGAGGEPADAAAGGADGAPADAAAGGAGGEPADAASPDGGGEDAAAPPADDAGPAPDAG